MCTIVRYTETDDYNNLNRVMKYIQGTIGLPLILSINNSVNIQCYVYAEFAVHNDMRSHNIGFPTMGTGGSYVQSRKYKMITKSSTGANLVRLDDFLTQVIWT